MPDNLLKVGAEIDVSKVQSALKEFVGAVDELGSRLTTDVPKASDKAKASLGLLGELIGVHIPEQLQTFVAGLPGICIHPDCGCRTGRHSFRAWHEAV